MKKTNRWLWTGMMLLFVALLMTGCSTEGGGGGEEAKEPGPPAQIIFKAFNNIVPINGVITITANITDTDDMKVADGTSVTMSDAQGLVTITPASQETVDGKATFVITGQVAGIANLICQAGGAIFTTSITIVDTAPTIVLTVDDTTILVGQVIEISATVMESNGTLVADDTEIKFDLSDDQLAELDETTVLTTNGVATVKLTARSAGTVVVGATYGAGTGTLEITIQEPGSVDPESISLSASAASVLMGGSIMITATVTGTGGQQVSDGTSVSFTVDSDAGSLYPATGQTTNGSTTTMLTGEKYGEVTITAKAGSVTDSTTVSVTANVDDLSISTTQTTVKTDNNDYAIITATAQDRNRVPIESVPITFQATAGLISDRRVVTDINGEAQITFKSGSDVDLGKTNQVVTISASTPDLETATIPVRLVGSTLTVQINNTSLEVGTATITDMTITARDAGGVAVYLAEVTLRQDSNSGSGRVLFRDPNSTLGGTATFTGTTDVTGTLVVSVLGDQAGNNTPITITATGLGATASQDVTVSGDAFEFQEGTPSTGETTGLVTDLTYTAVGSTIDHAVGDITSFLDFDGSGDGSDTLTPGIIEVTGSDFNDGYYLLNAVAVLQLTLNPSAILVNEGPANANGTITQVLPPDPTPVTGDYTTAPDYIAGETKSLVFLGVQSPDGNNVQITTTMGTLHAIGATTAVSGDGTSVLLADPPGALGTLGVVEFVLATTENAGVATLRAEDVTNSAINDSLRVAVAAPSSEASQIDIQASPTAIPTSAGGVQNISNLTITVKNAGDEVVSGASVFISLEDTTGGGEYVSPAHLYTDINGKAYATLYSGALNSDSLGINVLATLLDSGIDDNIRVVIGGTPSSVSIGAPTEFEAASASLYRKPMTVLVSDSNGNPVNGATVNLSVWPLGYYVGLTDATDGPLYWACSTGNLWAHPSAPEVEYYPNEDTNKNEILDPGEDAVGYPASGNGVLDPPKSSAGTVPTSVITDENGVAEFDFYQQKIYSTWTKVEIKASVVVYGSETIAVLPYGPNFLAGDQSALPDSPWGSSWTVGVCPP